MAKDEAADPKDAKKSGEKPVKRTGAHRENDQRIKVVKKPPFFKIL